MTMRPGTLVHLPARAAEKVSEDNLVSGVVTKDFGDTVNVRVFSDNNEFEWRTAVTVVDGQPEDDADAANVCWLASDSVTTGDTQAETPIAAPVDDSATVPAATFSEGSK